MPPTTMHGSSLEKQAELNLKLGTALLSIQKIEFMTHGLISHLPAIKSEKEFKGLTPRHFLDNDEISIKLRKQTLGQIFRILKLDPVLSIEKELNSFLEKRNYLIHGFWRSTVDGTFKHYDEAIAFCDTILKEASHLDQFYEGFIIEILLALAEKEQREVPTFTQNQQTAREYFKETLIRNRIKEM